MAFYMRHNEILLFGKEKTFHLFIVSMEKGAIESLGNTLERLKRRQHWKASHHPLEIFFVSKLEENERKNDEVKRVEKYQLIYSITHY